MIVEDELVGNELDDLLFCVGGRIFEEVLATRIRVLLHSCELNRLYKPFYPKAKPPLLLTIMDQYDKMRIARLKYEAALDGPEVNPFLIKDFDLFARSTHTEIKQQMNEAQKDVLDY